MAKSTDRAVHQVLHHLTMAVYHCASCECEYCQYRREFLELVPKVASGEDANSECNWPFHTCGCKCADCWPGHGFEAQGLPELAPRPVFPN